MEDLQKLETELEDIDLKKAASQWLRAGEILRAIRDEKLYKVKYNSFETYLQDRWDITKASEYRLINWVDSHDNLANNFLPGYLPENERQVCPLTQFELGQQVGLQNIANLNHLYKCPHPQPLSLWQRGLKRIVQLIKTSYKNKQIKNLEQEINCKNQLIESLNKELLYTKEIYGKITPFINQNFPVYISDNYSLLAIKKTDSILKHKVIICSIPKSGTYLYSELLKVLGLEPTNLHLSCSGFSDYRFATLKQVREEYTNYNVDVPLKYSVKLISKGQFAVGHLPCDSNTIEILKSFKIIFIYRNLRDAIVSYMRFLSIPGRSQHPLNGWKKIKDGPDKMLAYMDVHGKTFMEMCTPMSGWMDQTNVCQVSFEDLMGDYGLENQNKAIQKIIDFLQFTCQNNIDFQKVLNNVIGVETKTFSGQRTNRNLYWNEDVEESFSKLGGDLLNKKLGYGVGLARCNIQQVVAE